MPSAALSCCQTFTFQTLTFQIKNTYDVNLCDYIVAVYLSAWEKGMCTVKNGWYRFGMKSGHNVQFCYPII